MKKVLSLIFIMALFIVACGDGGDVFNKKSSAEEEQPDITTLPPIKPILMLSPAILEFMKRCPTVISCMPKERLEGLRIAMQLWAAEHPTDEDKGEAAAPLKMMMAPEEGTLNPNVPTDVTENQQIIAKPEILGGAILANTLSLF